MASDKAPAATNLPQQSVLKVLRDCISVLVDINLEIGKLEQFFTALKNFVEHLVMPEAENLRNMLDKAGRRSRAKGYLTTDDTTKQRIYITTLQTKAYFSLLYDIADMYVDVDLKYVKEGMKLSSNLSKIAAAKGNPQAALQELDDYNVRATAGIETLVREKQKAIEDGMKGRLKSIRTSVKVIEDSGKEKGLNNKADSKALEESKGAAVGDASAQLKHEEAAITKTQPKDPKEDIDYLSKW